MKKSLSLLLLFFYASFLHAGLITDHFKNDRFSVSATATGVSNYIWRGVSQNNNRATLQGDVTIETQSGFYGSVWASGVNFPDALGKPARQEVDYIAGYKNTIKALQYDMGVTRYSYPNTTAIDFSEYFLRLSCHQITAQINYADSVFHSNQRGIYYHLGLEQSLMPSVISDLTLAAGIGRYDFQRLFSDYTDYMIALKKGFKYVQLAVIWTDTNHKFTGNTLDKAHTEISITLLI